MPDTLDELGTVPDISIGPKSRIQPDDSAFRDGAAPDHPSENVETPAPASTSIPRRQALRYGFRVAIRRPATALGLLGLVLCSFYN